MLEVNCETDFAARNDQFKSFVHDVAMHIAASGPDYVSIDDVPADVVEKEKAVQIARVMEEGKPAHIAEKIVGGRLDKWKRGLCLLEQPFVKDDSKTVSQFTKDTVAVIGENIQIRRFTRYVLGEGLAKKEDDFAAEVAKMSN